MSAPHQLLSIARTARALSQSALASKMGTSQTQVSALESGRVPLEGQYLSSAATALELPEAFFGQLPPRHATDTSPFHYRKLQSVGATKQGQIHSKLQMLQLQVEELLRDDVDRSAFEGFRPFEVEEYRGGAREVAQLVRVSWGLPVGPVANAIHLVEQAGALVILCDFGTTAVDGLSRFVAGLPPMIFLNQSAPPDRMRRTVVHETGHLIMHVGRTPTPTLEEQADDFASEFLMPTREIRRDFAMGVDLQRLAGLKLKWGVSMQSLVMRANELGIIDAKKKKSLFVQMSMRGWRTREPVHVEPELPTALRGIIDGLRERGLSLEALAEQAKLTHKEFVSNFYPGRGGLRLIS